jgi:hypothetical protein
MSRNPFETSILGCAIDAVPPSPAFSRALNPAPECP